VPGPAGARAPLTSTAIAILASSARRSAAALPGLCSPPGRAAETHDLDVLALAWFWEFVEFEPAQPVLEPTAISNYMGS